MKGAEKLAKQWEDGNIVSCKQSLCAAQRYLKSGGLEIGIHNTLVGIVEHVRFHDRENFSVKKWKL